MAAHSQPSRSQLGTVTGTLRGSFPSWSWEPLREGSVDSGGGRINIMLYREEKDRDSHKQDEVTRETESEQRPQGEEDTQRRGNHDRETAGGRG